MRITIERLRTLVLGLGVLLVAALIGFLVLGRWKGRLLLHELPKRLGADIKQEANEIVYTQSRAGHMLFKIRASKEIQLKKSGRVVLQNVQIELYGPDGRTVDRITGNEFEYDQKAGRATATGPVEIAVSRPGEALGSQRPLPKSALGSLAKTAAKGEIDVKTDGLVFDQKSGTASTERRVEFETVQGSGSSEGATFDSNAGTLVLDRNVELKVRRGEQTIALHAQHAEFERGAMICRLRNAEMQSKSATVKAGQAQVGFREGGTVARLDGRDGLVLQSGNGSNVNAPTGWMVFDEQNQPVRGLLEGGVVIDSRAGARAIHGTSPAADLKFASGQLRSAHLERGVTLHSEESSAGSPLVRDWRSPVLDVAFLTGSDGKLGLEHLSGTGGVVVATQAQGGGKVLPSRLSADVVNGEFSEGRQLSRLVGDGHAQLEQTTQAGAKQTASADHLDVRLGSDHRAASKRTAGSAGAGSAGTAIESAVLDGNVIFTQNSTDAHGMTGRAAHAIYDASGDMIHLTGSPRVDQSGLQISAERIDVAQKTGQATAQGNVKATWLGGKAGGKGENAVAFGGSTPAHIVSDQAELQQSTGEAVFKGHARLWQEASSVTAPLIVLNRTRQTLEARSTGASQPVALVLQGRGTAVAGEKAKAQRPSVVGIKAGDFKYSGAERKAILHAGSSGPVVADTGTATVSSKIVEITFLPPGNHAGDNGGSAQVDSLTARGKVTIDSASRHGAGEQLVYSSETGDYVLTGTSGAPPTISDSAHGSVTGAALIFNTRDDSVRVEGDGHRTMTETTVPRR